MARIVANNGWPLLGLALTVLGSVGMVIGIFG